MIGQQEEISAFQIAETVQETYGIPNLDSPLYGMHYPVPFAWTLWHHLWHNYATLTDLPTAKTYIRVQNCHN